METAKRIVILLILVLFISGTIQSAEKPAKGKISNTRFASCVVKITANPNVFPLNYEAVEFLLRSSSIAGKAGREVLGLSPERSVEFFGIEPLPRDSAGAIPPEPQRLGDEPMTDERMMRRDEQMMRDNERRMREDSMNMFSDIYGEMMDKPTGSATRQDRSESRSERSYRRGREGIDLYGREVRRPRVVAPEPPRPDVEQTLLFQLRVELPEDVKPAAEEFMHTLIDLMRRTILDEARDYSAALQNRLSRVRQQRERAQAQFSEIMEQAKAIEPPQPIEQDPADIAVHEQLDQIADLSMLSPSMTFGDAIERLKNSVEPPLKIVVLWRDLLDNADIEQSTEINMDGIPGVRLGTVLELLLKAVSDGFSKLGYVIKNGVITISTVESLPSKFETRIYEIPGPFLTANELADAIQETIDPDSWYDAGGEGTISTYMGKKLVILQTPEIHRKIQNFLQTIKIDVPVDIPVDISLEQMLDEKHNLLRDKRNLEMKVAQLEARHTAIEEQIAKMSNEINTKVEDDPVTRELQEIVDMYSERCSKFEELVTKGGRVSSPELENEMNKLVQAKKELAKRRGELSRSAGGDQLARFNSGLADIMIELAEKRAELGVVDKQLKQIEGQLTMATAFDPQVLQIRLAQQALEVADRRVSELENLLDNLQEPTVTVLGAG